MKEIQPSAQIEIEKGIQQDVLPGYEGEVAALLNVQKFNELNKFFTNPFGRVTAVRSNPRDMTAAILTARLSRAGERDVSELFWNEFRKRTGEEVGDRILNEFGDDSVREDASGYVFVRDVSVLSSMQIFRHPLITGIESSTRYINWGELPLDEFAVQPERIMNDPEAKEIYMGAVAISYETYRELWPYVWEHFVNTNPREEGQSDTAYKKAIKGATCDALRGLLVLGVKTNFGLHANFRTFSEVIMNLRASDFPETAEVADEIGTELMKVNPVFLKVVDSEHGREWTKYQKLVSKILKGFGTRKVSTIKQQEDLSVTVEVLNKDWSRDLLRAALVAMNGERPEYPINDSLDSLLANIGGARGNRRHKLPNFLNSLVVRDRVENSSFGAYKDINRHRFLLDKSQPDYSGSRGHVVPFEVEKIGGRVKELYVGAQNSIHEAMVKLKEKYPEESKLLLTHGTKTAFEMLMGGGEHFWISEIRSSPGGNPEYRQIAVELYRRLIEAAAKLKILGSFVDENTYTLGRIGEAVRADLKGK